MNPIFDGIYKVDWTQVSPDVMEGLLSGRLNWPDGTGIVRDASGSIAKHLPLVRVGSGDAADPAQLAQLANAIKASQAAAVTATTVSTVIVVAVVVAATAYLSNKIDGVTAAVQRIYGAVDQQSRRELLTQVGEYAAAIKVAQGWLTSKAPASETGELLLSMSISRMKHLREQTMHFVQGLPSALKALDESGEAQFAQTLDFMVHMLDWVPMALRIEEQLCTFAGKPTLAAEVMEKGVADFQETKGQFRRWCDGQYELLARGRSDFGVALLARRQDLRDFFNSPIHSMLLDRPVVGPVVRREPEREHAAAIGEERDKPANAA